MVAPVVLAAGIAAASQIAGGIMGSENTRKLTHEQMDMQREFAQHGIQWKVEDAKRAGIHPLYALGASTSSPSPVHVQGGDYGISAAGQDVSRAIMASQDADDRKATVAAAAAAAARAEARDDLRLTSSLENDKVMR